MEKKTLLYIAVGGFFGASLRYIICLLLFDSFIFPNEILLINTVGCFILAFSMGIFKIKSKKNIESIKKAVTTGFLWCIYYLFNF